MTQITFNNLENLEKILPLLKFIGISESEFKIYLQLLSAGPCTKTEFAKEFKIPRTTVFINIEKLIQKGLVIEITKDNKKTIVAENPKKLELIVFKKKVEIDEETERLKQFNNNLPELIESITRNLPKVQEDSDILVKYYTGLAGFRQTCQRSLDTSSKEILSISNAQELWKEHTAEYLNKYYKPERVRQKIFLKSLVVQNNDAEELKRLDPTSYRETRVLPKGYDFKPTVLICDKEVSIIQAAQPCSAIVIQNQDIADLFKAIFQNMWLSNQ